MTQKERTINELRQVKDSVYNHPNNKDEKSKRNNKNSDKRIITIRRRTIR